MNARQRRKAPRQHVHRGASSPVYVISVAAELTDVHVQTLRNYERHGLLAPARTEGGNRRYSDADLALIRRITKLTDDGLTLSGVRRILNLEQRLAELTPTATALLTLSAAQLPPQPPERRKTVTPPTTRTTTSRTTSGSRREPQ